MPLVFHHWKKGLTLCLPKPVVIRGKNLSEIGVPKKRTIQYRRFCQSRLNNSLDWIETSSLSTLYIAVVSRNA
ncbi:hypothetical protein EMCRGX_G008788 [Ephydatia muelleri]